jgi:hypothetical protein
MIMLMMVLLNAAVLTKGYTDSKDWYWGLLVTLPLLLVLIRRSTRPPSVNGDKNV